MLNEVKKYKYRICKQISERAMNIETHIVEEPTFNYETREAINDVKSHQGTKVKDS